MNRRAAHLALAAALMAVTACEESAAPSPERSAPPAFGSKAAPGGHALLVRVNHALAARGKPFRVDRAEWVTRGGGEQAGQIVFANDRGNKQISDHFVAGDPRRFGSEDIFYLVDQSDGAATGGLGNAATEAAIDRAVRTWEITTACSNFSLVKLPDAGADPDLIDGFVLGDAAKIGTPFADITHAGWTPAAFFDALTPGGSQFIVGVTFSFIFVDGATGAPTDIDRNGKADAAFREIYFSNAFPWGIDTDNTTAIDVETVVLHETGHGLSQAHFGKIFGTFSNLRLHFAPLAVMNAAISVQQQRLKGSDTAGHCSLWGRWPN